MQSIRVAVAGAGAFGRNHLRVLRSLEGAELVAAVDTDPQRAAEAAREWGCEPLTLEQLPGRVDAAVVAVPTVHHAAVAIPLLEAGIDVLVEKPIAHDLASARAIIDAAERNGRVLQIGHLERFNPAVRALRAAATLPLFFEIHRMSVFTPRSLDVDVVLDLMIHDVDILLSLVRLRPEEIRAAGIRILSGKADIANVRLSFPNGCIANLTASRVSTEKIRKLRLFQPGQYISLDYQKQEIARFSVTDTDAAGAGAVRLDIPEAGLSRAIDFDSLAVEKGEPLRLELASFLQSVRSRSATEVPGREGAAALEVCLAILDKIEEHGRDVARTLKAYQATAHPA